MQSSLSLRQHCLVEWVHALWILQNSVALGELFWKLIFLNFMNCLFTVAPMSSASLSPVSMVSGLLTAAIFTGAAGALCWACSKILGFFALVCILHHLLEQHVASVPLVKNCFSKTLICERSNVGVNYHTLMGINVFTHVSQEHVHITVVVWNALSILFDGAVFVGCLHFITHWIILSHEVIKNLS